MFNAIFKKSIAIILCITLLVLNVPLTALAMESEISLNLDEYLNAEIETKTVISGDAQLAESINTQLKNFAASVDISKFGLRNTTNNQQKIVDILSGGLPECFHINSRFTISLSLDGRYITAINPTYSYSKAKYQSMLAECEAAADKMLQDIEGDNKLTDVEKLLLLHDRIAITCEYDYENYLNNSIPKISHTMYGVLVNKIAVCQGYALAYSYLLNRIGIENYYCGSNALYHAWNVVYVNGKAYHVDITWDDTTWDVTGEVSHDNFLVSTSKLVENGHTANDYNTAPTDTTYDNYFWQNSITAFTLLDGEIYYIDNVNHNIMRYSDNTVVCNIKSYWRANAEYVYTLSFARLATDGKNLLFSLNDGIYKLNIKTSKVSQVHKPELSGLFGIYGFTYSDGMLVYDVNDHPSFDENTKKLYEYKVPYTPDIPGDIDDSSEVDLQDVVIVAQAFAGWGVNNNEIPLDLNGDGFENLKDLIHLAQYVAGWQGIVLH